MHIKRPENDVFHLDEKPTTRPLRVCFHVLIPGCYVLTQDCTKTEVKFEEFWRLSCMQGEEGGVQKRGKKGTQLLMG
jgi:hypothetical protein